MRRQLNFFKARRQRGATLIEGVLFVVIGMGLILGGFALYLHFSEGSRTNNAVRSIIGIQSGVRALYMGNSDFPAAGDDLEGAVIRSGLVSANLISEDGKLVNEWNGPITVRGFNGGFVVDYGAVSVDACVRLAVHNPQGVGNAGLGIGAVIINGVVADADGDGEVTPLEAAAACQAAAG